MCAPVVPVAVGLPVAAADEVAPPMPPVVLVGPAPVLVLVAAVVSSGSDGALQPARMPGRRANVANAANAGFKVVVGFTMPIAFESCLGRVLGSRLRGPTRTRFKI